MNSLLTKEPAFIDFDSLPYHTTALPNDHSTQRQELGAHEDASTSHPSVNSTTHVDEPFLLDVSNYDPGYDADVEVVLPYAIEEPDDEPDQVSASASSKPTTPKLRGFLDLWQSELVNSMRDLYCDSDSNDTRPWLGQKRGRKRKTTQYHSTGSPDTVFEVEFRPEGSASQHKRMRKRSKDSKEEVNTARNTLLPAMAMSEASKREMVVGLETSGANEDKMDVD